MEKVGQWIYEFLNCCYLHNIIKSTRNYPTAIRSEFYSTDALAMTLVCMNTSFFSDVPKLKISVHGARCKKLTEWMKLNSSTIRSVPSNSANHYTSRTITQILKHVDKLKNARIPLCTQQLYSI